MCKGLLISPLPPSLFPLLTLLNTANVTHYAELPPGGFLCINRRIEHALTQR